MKKRSIYYELSTCGGMLIFLFIIEFFVFDFTHMNLRIPFLYTHDGLGSTAYVKNILENGWLSDTERLSAPFVFSTKSFTPLLFINTSILLYKFLGMFTSDPVLIFNLRILLTPVFNTFFAYYVLRKMHISRIYAMLGAVSFGSCFFVLSRFGHIDFASCEAIPLTILLCYWCTQEQFPFRRKNWFRERRFWQILFFSWLIANDGIGYYPFFCCFFLVCVAVYNLVSTGKVKSVVFPAMCIASVVFFFLLNFLPLLIVKTNTHVEQRSAMESELYGLRIAGLYLSPEGFGIKHLKQVYSTYLGQSILINENATSYLGVIGVLGSIILFLQLMQGKKGAFADRIIVNEDIYWLSCLQFMGILLGASAGLSMIFSLIVSSSIRAYNRISIFLQFITITGFLYFCEGINDRTIKRKSISIGLCIAAVLLTFLDLNIVEPRYSSNTNAEDYLSDKIMIADLEKSVEDGAMIYQLPYMPYPEAAPIRGMNHTFAMVPYLLSDHLRWSHGSTSPEAIQWNASVADCECSEMTDILALAGFSGILIDTRAYTDAELSEMREKLEMLTMDQPRVSANSNYIYYSLIPIRDKFEDTLSDTQMQAGKRFALQYGQENYGSTFHSANGLSLMINGGFYNEEKNSDAIWRWCKNNASISYFSEKDEIVSLHFRIQKVTDQAELKIRCENETQIVNFADIGEDLIVNLPVHKGENIIYLDYDGKILSTKTDSRKMAYRLFYDAPSEMMNISSYWTYFQ